MKIFKEMRYARFMIIMILFALEKNIYAEKISEDSKSQLETLSTADKPLEEKVGRKNAFLLIPYGPFLGTYYIEYQRALDQRNALLFGVNYVNPLYGQDHLIGAWLLYRYKVFKNNNGPLDGFGIMGGLEVEVPVDIPQFVLALSPHVYLQYQWVLINGIAIELFAGPQIIFVTQPGTKYDEYNNKIIPSFGVEVGYAF